MLHPIFYHAALIAVCAYAFLHGRRDERFAALICIMATVATRLAVSPLSERYSDVEIGVLLVDLLALGGFVFIALRTDRFWPLWVAGLQLTTMISHGLKAVELDLVPHAYGAAARFWVYPIFLIIVVGTWRSHQSARREAISPSLP